MRYETALPGWMTIGGGSTEIGSFRARTRAHARIAALVVALLFAVLAASPVPAFAEILQWDGTADTSWFDPSNKKTAYEISTPEQLAGLAKILDPDSGTSQQANHFYGTTFTQTADFSLYGHRWTPIDGFGGVYDGGGHRIESVEISSNNGASPSFLGLFGVVDSNFGGTGSDSSRECGIKNLRMDCRIRWEEVANITLGALVAHLNNGAFVQKCTVQGLISIANVRGDTSIGGIVGRMGQGAKVLESSSSVLINQGSGDEDAAAGGIVGTIDADGHGSSVTHSYYDGLISSQQSISRLGGIVGRMRTRDQVEISHSVVVKGFSPDADGWCALVGTIDGDAKFNPKDIMWGLLWPDATSFQPAFAIDELDGTAPVAMGLCGQAVGDFSDLSLVDQLNEGGEDIWAMATGLHPVLAFQEWLLPADYSAIYAALAKIPADLETAYLPEGVEEVKIARDSAQSGLGMTLSHQDEVDRLAQALEDALANLIARTYDLRIAPTAPKDLTYGYELPEFTHLDIVNMGNSDATVASAELRGDDAASFELREPEDKVVPTVGGNTGWAVRPKAGLNAGIYEADFVVTYDGGASAETRLCVLVAKATQGLPEGVKARPESAKGAKDGALLGLTPAMEWRPAGGAWAAASSSSVTGLAPGTYEVRYAETENYEASDVVTIEVKAAPVEVDPPSGEEPPVDPPTEENPPVDPPAEENPPVDPPAEESPPVDPPQEDDLPVNPPSEEDPPAGVNPPAEPPAGENPPVGDEGSNGQQHNGSSSQDPAASEQPGDDAAKPDASNDEVSSGGKGAAVLPETGDPVTRGFILLPAALAFAALGTVRLRRS